MTISMGELRKIIDAAGTDLNNKVQNVPDFSLIVSYKITGENVTVTDTIYGCSIDSTMFELNQNDMNIEVEINLNPIGVTYGSIA